MKRLAVINVNMKRGEPVSTYRVGFLPKGTRYKDIIKVFGKPRNVWPDEDQTKAQWTGEINRETFTIYDYDSGKSLESNTDWHIGGHDDKVAQLVLDYFNSKSGKASKALKNVDTLYPRGSAKESVVEHVKDWQVGGLVRETDLSKEWMKSGWGKDLEISEVMSIVLSVLDRLVKEGYLELISRNKNAYRVIKDIG